MKRRGGGKSLQKELGGNNKNVQSMSGGVMNSSKQWIPVSGMSSTAELPTEEGKVKIVETMVPALMDKATNPTGAVAVVKYGPNTYCTSISCASCKIPMTKIVKGLFSKADDNPLPVYELGESKQGKVVINLGS